MLGGGGEGEKRETLEGKEKGRNGERGEGKDRERERDEIKEEREQNIKSVSGAVLFRRLVCLCKPEKCTWGINQ